MTTTTEMNKEMELNLNGMEQGNGGAVVHHEGKYWVVEDPPTRGTSSITPPPLTPCRKRKTRPGNWDGPPAGLR